MRVKGINRINIPGSFVVNILADGNPVARRYFFQPDPPHECETCTKHPLVNIDFRIDREEILDRELTVTIDVPAAGAEVGTRFPRREPGTRR